MNSPAVAAFQAYTATLFGRRALWIVLVITGLFAVGIVAAWVLGRVFSVETLEHVAEVALLPGVPLGALLLSEMPIRDGIRHRTLLYHLLAPVPRSTLLAVRTLVTGVLLALILSVTLVEVHILDGGTWATVPRELFAVLLGAAVYVALFGLIHLLTSHGLIAGLVIIFMFDIPLGMLPFGIRNLSPSYHVRVLADRVVQMDLPIPVQSAPPNFLLSTITLLVLTVILLALSGTRFRRMNLGELC